MIFALLLLIFFIFIIGGLLWCFKPFKPGKWFYHDILKWHAPDPKASVKFDGASFHTYCKYCGKEIMLDSQGNWFEKEEK